VIEHPQLRAAAWPACPRCGSAEHVHRAGLHVRLQFPAAQKFSCTRCGKDKKFLAASERKYRPGRRKHFQRFQLQPQPGASGRWKIKRELSRSLLAMYREAHGVSPDREALDRFISELIENAVGDFRLRRPRDAFLVLKEVQKQPVDPLREAHYA
jgi:transposase-like protein